MMQSMSKINPSIAACLFALSPDDDGAIQLFPAGDFDAPRSALRGQGPWHLNADSAQQLISACAQRANDMLIDYEHQFLHSAKNGLPVPAAGWIDSASLEWRDDPAAATGLFARQVKWVGDASALIAADIYRYLSPVFSYDAKTGTVLDIINVALTNSPAIDGMQAVTIAAASFMALTSTPLPEPEMNEEIRERLLYVLNLPTLATDADIIAELDKAKALLASGVTDAAATSLADLCTAKDTKIAALSAQVGIEARSTEVDPTQYAPIAVVTELRTRLAALSTTANVDQVEKLITEGIAQGKLIGESEQAWARSVGKKDIAALSHYLDSAQPIAALSGMQSAGKVPVAVEIAALSATAEEQAVAAQLGISHEDIVKQRSAK
jgi:phage I-like protein